MNLCKSQNKVDIICTQESWLKPSQSYNIPGYNSIRCDRLNKSGGGTVIFIDSSRSCHEIKIDSAIECCVVELKVKSEWITVANVYQCLENVSLNDYENLFNLLPSKAIICGDFNSHNIICGSNSTNNNGQILETFIDNSDLVLLNTGEGTRINHLGTTSAIDPSIVDPSLGGRCS